MKIFVYIKNNTSTFIDALFSNPLRTLFYLFIFLPLVYIPGQHIYSRSIRLSFVVLVSLVILVVPSFTARFVENFRQLHRVARWILLCIILLMCISAVASNLGINVVMFGREPDYMGIVGWLAIMSFGLLYSSRSDSLLFSLTMQRINSAVLAVSLIMGSLIIVEGYRLPGLMMQATTMGMYAVLSLIVALRLYVRSNVSRQSRIESWLAIFLSIATIVFTQSRISYIALVFVLAFFAYLHLNKKILTIVSVVVSLFLAGVSLVNVNYFSRLQASSVERGIAYRMDIYKMTVGEVADHYGVIGGGPSALPIDLNNVDIVPEDIAKTLNEGFIFVSAHDLIIDFALYFGAVAAVLLLVLFCWALIRKHPQTVGGSKEQQYIWVYFTVLALNAVCNTISPEMLVITFMVLFRLLMTRLDGARKTIE